LGGGEGSHVPCETSEMPNSNERRRWWCILEVLQAYASRDPPKEHPQMVFWQGSLGFSFILSLSLPGKISNTDRLTWLHQMEWCGFTSIPYYYKGTQRLHLKDIKISGSEMFRSNDWQSVYTKTIPSLDANTSFIHIRDFKHGRIFHIKNPA
jgi:hypothetical protein